MASRGGHCEESGLGAGGGGGDGGLEAYFGVGSTGDAIRHRAKMSVDSLINNPGVQRKSPS